MRRVALLLLLPAVASAEAPPVVRREVCDRLAALPPAADVAVGPGVDARGRAVTPADLPGSGFRPEEFPIEIDVDLRRRFGIPADRRLFEGEAKLGAVVLRDGKAFFNGQPLDEREQAMLAFLCRDRARR